MGLTKDDVLGCIQIICMRTLFQKLKSWNSYDDNSNVLFLIHGCHSTQDFAKKSLVDLQIEITDDILLLVNSSTYKIHAPDNIAKLFANEIASYINKAEYKNCLFKSKEKCVLSSSDATYFEQLCDNLKPVSLVGRDLLESYYFDIDRCEPDISFPNKKNLTVRNLTIDDFNSETEKFNPTQCCIFLATIICNSINDLSESLFAKRSQEIVDELDRQYEMTIEIANYWNNINNKQVYDVRLDKEIKQGIVQHSISHNKILKELEKISKLKEDISEVLISIKNFSYLYSIGDGSKILESIRNNVNVFYNIILKNLYFDNVMKGMESLMDEHMFQNQVLIDKMISVKHMADDYAMCKVRNILNKTGIFNHEIFIDSAKNDLSSNYEHKIKTVAKEVYAYFHEELMPAKAGDFSVNALESYAEELKAKRSIMLNEIVEKAVANVNVNRLLQYYKNDSVATDFVIYTIDDLTFQECIDESLNFLKYDAKIVIEHVTKMFSIKEIIEYAELFIKVKSTADEIKKIVISENDNLDNEFSKLNIIIDKESLNLKRIKYQKIINNFDSVSVKIFADYDQDEVFVFPNQIKSKLLLLSTFEDEYFKSHEMCVEKIEEALRLAHDTLYGIARFNSKLSIKSLPESCDIIAKSFKLFKVNKSIVEESLEKLKVYHESFSEMIDFFEEMDSSNLRFFGEDKIIDFFKVLADLSLLTKYTKEILNLFSEGKNVAGVIQIIYSKFKESYNSYLDVCRVFLSSLNLDDLSKAFPDDSMVIKHFLNIHIPDLEVIELVDLVFLHNHIKFGYSMYMKHRQNIVDPRGPKISTDKQLIRLKDFAEYRNKNSDSCVNLFVSRPILHFSKRLDWYKELELSISQVNYRLLCGDNSSSTFIEKITTLSNRVAAMLNDSDPSSTFLAKILNPLNESLRRISVSILKKHVKKQTEVSLYVS